MYTPGAPLRNLEKSIVTTPSLLAFIESAPGGENSNAELAMIFPGRSMKSAICRILFAFTLRCHSFSAFFYSIPLKLFLWMSLLQVMQELKIPHQFRKPWPFQ